MAYQNVGTPKFYINIPEWLASTGAVESIDEKLRTLPVQPSNRYDIDLELYGMTENGFIAVLGHEYAKLNDYYYLNKGVNSVQLTEVVNNNLSGDVAHPQYDGFSISTFTGSNDISKFATSNGEAYNIGSVVIGTYYEMPNAPDLSLTIGREYDGTKTFSTDSGSSMSNTMWSKPPNWGDLGAWELSRPLLAECVDDDEATASIGGCAVAVDTLGCDFLWGGIPLNEVCPETCGNCPEDDGFLYDYGLAHLSRSGRRSWDLKFSFMDDGGLWGSNQLLSFIREDSTDGTDSGDNYNSTTFNYNLLTDYNFFSQVWHKTLGGTLPFIFQPDAPVLNETTGEYEGGNNNPDQFAICKFKDNSLKATQSAFNVYDISLSIEEVW